MNRLQEVFSLFLRLGVTAFGGPAAHIAMMHREVVLKKKWLDDQEFISLVGITNLIPGPNSTELAIHLGKERAGWKGLLLAGLCFILPAVAITLLIAWLYKEFGTLPQVQPLVYGIRPAVLAIILIAILPLAKASIKNSGLLIVAIVAFVLSMLGLTEITVMFGLGLLYVGYSTLRTTGNITVFLPLLYVVPEKTLSNSSIFLVFLKIGAILYGSGYVLFAFIEDDLVTNGVISSNQLLDAISVGQITPGPVFSSVTFIGYQIDGMLGAGAATLGVFLPSFIFVGLISIVKQKLSGSVLFSRFLSAVNAASVAIIAVVCLKMGKGSVTDIPTVIIAVIALLLLWKFPQINSAYIVLLGSIAGYLFSLL